MNHSMSSSLLNKVAEGIYHLIVRYPFAMRELNSYLFLGENGFTVVDTGSISEQSMSIWKKVIDSGVQIEKVICTHAHPDHIGLARWFQENYRIPVYLSAQSYEELIYIRSNKDTIWLQDLFAKHNGPASALDRRARESEAYHFEPDGLFTIGEKVKLGDEEYETIWTPGHAADHACFYNHRKQVLVLGDLVLAEVSPIVGSFTERDSNPLKSYLQSIKKISVYSPKISLPGHGSLIHDLQARIEEIQASHQHRLNQILTIVSSEPKNSYQICQELYGGVEEKKIFAPLLSTISRVIYLESIGKLTCHLERDVYYYAVR